MPLLWARNPVNLQIGNKIASKAKGDIMKKYMVLIVLTSIVIIPSLGYALKSDEVGVLVLQNQGGPVAYSVVRAIKYSPRLTKLLMDWTGNKYVFLFLFILQAR